VAWLGALFAEHMLHTLYCCVLVQACGMLHVLLSDSAPARACNRSPIVMSSAVACMFDHSQVQCECLNLVYSCDATVVVGCQLSPLETLRTLQHALQLQRSLDKL
jgi:hypothetical protein